MKHRPRFAVGDLIFDEDMVLYQVMHVGPGAWRRQKMSLLDLKRRPPLPAFEVVRVCQGHFIHAYETFTGVRSMEAPPHLHKGFKRYWFLYRQRGVKTRFNAKRKKR